MLLKSLLLQFGGPPHFPLINTNTLNRATLLSKWPKQTKEAASKITLSPPYHACHNTLCPRGTVQFCRCMLWLNRGLALQDFFSLHSPPNRRRQVQAVCSTHGRAGAVNTQHLAVKPDWGLSVSPWHLFTESTPRPRPIPARLYQRESQQNGGTDTSHVTSLCFRVQFQVKQMDTTRLTNKISHRGNRIITHVVERGRNTQYSSRSVVCTKEQIWRPFCTSLRRQHSGAPRCENTAKVIHHQSGSTKKTYRFLLFFHPSWHLRYCPVDWGIFVQVRQILAAEDG